MSNYYEQGFELHKRAPDLLLIEVGRQAPLEGWFDFVLGYSDARRQKNDYEREKRNAVHRQDT
jgi:hypothetical protein